MKRYNMTGSFEYRASYNGEWASFTEAHQSEQERDALKAENTKMKGLLEDMAFVDDSLAFYVDSPERLAELLADDQLGDDKELTIGVAINHPSRLMRVWLTGGEERKLNWEWVK